MSVSARAADAPKTDNTKQCADLQAKHDTATKGKSLFKKHTLAKIEADMKKAGCAAPAAAPAPAK